MDEYEFIDTNGEDDINRFLEDTFAPLDEDNLHDIHDVPLTSHTHYNMQWINMKPIKEKQSKEFSNIISQNKP